MPSEEEFPGPFKVEHFTHEGRLYALEFWWIEDWDRLPIQPEDAAVVGPMVISVTCIGGCRMG